MQDIIKFMQLHSTLSIAFICVIVLLGVIEFIRLKRGSNQLTPSTAIDWINHKNAIVVDIRTKDAFKQGHIVDAISLPLTEVNENYKKLEKYKSQPLIIASTLAPECAAPSLFLEKNGFTVFILAGGMNAWRAEQLPITKDTSVL